MWKYIIIIIVLVGGLFGLSRVFFSGENNADIQPISEVQAEPLDREEIVEIESGMTFSEITEKVGISGTLMNEILAVSEEVYDLTRVRAGRQMKFYFDKESNVFKKLVYQLDSEEELEVSCDELGVCQADRYDIDYEIKIKTVEGVIETSLYESAVAQDVDIRAIIELADVFAWTVDFGMGIRVGDTYKFIFEERYRDGEYQMPGEVLAAKFVNDGKVIEGYYFEEGLDEDGDIIDGYYDLEGQSLQKIFLKNPVDFKYISSGYTTGLRYVEAFNVSTGHRAIDYAAALGTPIRAVGDGTVTFAGWSSAGYGYLTSIRHNSIYSTNYAHQSRIAVSYGEKVKQGQVIGYVGSTGFSTGPHLHFEMVKNGTKINPLTVDLPSDKAVAEENMEAFLASIDEWRNQLNN